MKVPNVKSAVIEQIDRSIPVDFSFDESEWIDRYNTLVESESQLMISRLIRNVCITMEESIRDRKDIHFPKLGVFRIKLGKLKAIQFRKDSLAEREVETITDLPIEERLEVINEVKDKMRKFKSDTRNSKNIVLKLKINKK